MIRFFSIKQPWILAALIVFVSQTAFADEQLLEKIHRATSSIKSLSADFVSTKAVAFLEDPIVTKGHIYYSADQGIRWEVLEPYRMALVYNETGVTHFISNQKKQWKKQEMDSDMVLVEIMKQLKTWLSGEAFVMHDMYEIKITSSQPVTAIFIPKDTMMRKVLAKLEFAFGEDLSVVETLKVIEDEGDTTTIAYQAIQINPALKKSLFQ